MRRIGWWTACGLVAASSACGGKSAGGDFDGADVESASGVASDKRLVDTTRADIALLCDWVADLQGGYGSEMTCADGGVTSTYATRAECVESGVFPEGCTATVAEFEECAEELTLDLCRAETALSSPKCAPLASCFSATSGHDATSRRELNE